MSFWQQHRIRLDPWPIDYEAAMAAETEEETETAGVIDLDVEYELDQWQAIPPPKNLQIPDQLVFVDGRRRLDARFLGEKAQAPVYGAFATFAVGAVQLTRSIPRAEFVELQVHRAIATGAELKPEPLRLGNAQNLAYETCLTGTENTPMSPMTLVQAQMIQAEKQVIERWQGNGSLVFCDGPLRSGLQVANNTVGYVKTIGKSYLSDAAADVMLSLKPGERTPIFKFGPPSWRRYSWYLRSGRELPSFGDVGYHRFHGLVRLEVYGAVAFTKAQRLANLTALLVPQYASQPVRDPRAPQNLLPTGALERKLGQMMGDRTLIDRYFRKFFAELAPVASV